MDIFKTGYAYAKGIKVIPVGIGVSIGSLKPPINMLQGFDITSGESLNNILTIINREFSCEFQPCFDENDYLHISDKNMQNAALIPSVFSNVCSLFYGADRSCAKQKLEKVKEKLSQQGYQFTCNERMLLSGGLRAEIVEKPFLDYDFKDYHFELSLSTHSFHEAFDTLNLVTTDFASDLIWLDCHVIDGFHVINKPEDLSSVICKYPNYFSYSPLAPQFFLYKDKLHLHIKQTVDNETGIKETQVRFGFSPSNVTAGDIIELISVLFDIGIISK